MSQPGTWLRLREGQLALPLALAFLSLFLAPLLMLCGVVALGLAQWALAAARLSAAADLSALAGAQAWSDPCGRAAHVATANKATLVDCVLDGTDVIATVQIPAPPFAARVAALLGQDALALSRRARAGQQEVEQPHGG